MTNEEALKLNNYTVFAHKFQLELDGIDKQVVKETSFPIFYEQEVASRIPNRNIKSTSEIVNAEMHTIFYYNAAPEVINWLKNRETKNGKLTVFDNGDKPFIVFDLIGCFIKQVNFGHGTYEGQELQTLSVSYSCLATPSVAKE